MAKGEAIKECFTIINSNPQKVKVIPDIPVDTVKDCCFALPVLAKISGGDELTNDKSAPIWFYDEGIAGATMELQEYVGGSWAFKTLLTDNTYGTHYPFGFEVNDAGENLMGYEIDWSLVLAAFGEGTYRIATTETPIIGSSIESLSIEFSLMTYTEDVADTTVRFTWFNEGIIGDPEDDEKCRDFGTLSWCNQLRLPNSKFGFNNSEYTSEHVRYQNGRQEWIKDDQVENYIFKSGRYPEFIHKIIKIDAFQSETLIVTDYNKNSANEIIEKAVIRTSAYEPKYVDGVKLASVEVTFSQLFQNFKHDRC